ncbi:MAG: peptidylprolyl isomerase [Xylophilus ampelinus]
MTFCTRLAATLAPLAPYGLAAVLAAASLSAAAQGLRPSSGTGLAPRGAPAASSAIPAAPAAAVPGASRGAGSADPGTRQADYIVAVVNSEPITNSEVQARIARVSRQIAQQNGGSLPPREALAREVLERLVLEKAQLQQARDLGIKVDDGTIDLAEENVARQNDTDVPGLRRRLAAEGLTPARFREELRNQITLQRLREREVENRVKISDLELDQYIQEQQQGGPNGAQALAPAAEINLAQVLVVVPEDARPDQVAPLLEKARRIAERARAGEDFSQLARTLSDAPDHAGGGVLGLRSVDRYPSLFVEATRNAKPGDIVGPIRSPAGFHILRVIEKLQPDAVASKVMQSHARHILLRTSPQMTESQAIAQLADLKRRIQSGQTDFAALAKEYSQDGSAAQGGDLGWANPGQFVPEFEEALGRLSPGQVSDPVVSRFGVHLIQLVERREHTLNQREQREMARGAVREKKLDEAYANWLQELRGRAYVELREPPQ